MRAGDLRERIDIFRKVRTPDGMGGHEEAEVALLSVFAQVRVPAARDGVVAMRDVELRTHEILVRRPLPETTPVIGDVVLWRGVRLLIRTTRPTDRCDGLFLECVSEV